MSRETSPEHACNVDVINPWLYIDLPDGIDNNYGVGVGSSNGQDQVVAIVPRFEVISAYNRRGLAPNPDHDLQTYRSPTFPSTVRYPSPESAVMKTTAMLFPRAAFAAALTSVSLSEEVNAVPSADALVLSAASG